jgi:hypothetical protein
LILCGFFVFRDRGKRQAIFPFSWGIKKDKLIKGKKASALGDRGLAFMVRECIRQKVTRIDLGPLTPALSPATGERAGVRGG